MGAPTLFVNKFAAAVSSSTAAAGVTVFTHSSALKNPDGSAGMGGVLDRMVFYNPDNIVHNLSVHRVAAGGSAGSTNLIDQVLLPSSGTPYILEGPYYGNSGDFYAMRLGEITSGSPVAAQAYYHEMS